MKNKNPIIKIEKYVNEKGVWYAVTSKKERIEMPAAYADMYNSDHLCIQLREISIFDSESLPKQHYVPLLTTPTPDWRA